MSAPLAGLVLLCSAAGALADVPADQLPSQADGDHVQWRLSMQSSRYSDALALRHWGQADWAQHVQARAGANLVQVEQSVALARSAQGSSHQWAWVVRQKGRIVLDEASAQRITQIGSGQKAAQDWQWQPQVHYKSFSGYGLDWQYLAPARDGLYIEGGAQALVLTKLAMRSLGGEVDFSAMDGRYGFDAQSVESSKGLRYPFQKPFDSTGQGLLLQGRLGWRSGAWHVQAGVRDVGWLFWRGLPQQQLNLNSSTQTLDANGYVLYKPLIQGQNSQPNVRWSAPWTGELQLAWRADVSQTWSLPWTYVPGFGWLPALRWQHDATPLKWALTWRQHQRDLLGQWQWGGWGLTWALGRANNSQQWGVSYGFVF